MIEQFKLFLFVLSIVFTLRFVVEFIIKLFQEEPQPMEVSSVKEVFIYLALSYIITYIII
jgi:hypothetical protein